MILVRTKALHEHHILGPSFNFPHSLSRRIKQGPSYISLPQDQAEPPPPSTMVLQSVLFVDYDGMKSE